LPNRTWRNAWRGIHSASEVLHPPLRQVDVRLGDRTRVLLDGVQQNQQVVRPLIQQAVASARKSDAELEQLGVYLRGDWKPRAAARPALGGSGTRRRTPRSLPAAWRAGLRGTRGPARCASCTGSRRLAFARARGQRMERSGGPTTNVPSFTIACRGAATSFGARSSSRCPRAGSAPREARSGRSGSPHAGSWTTRVSWAPRAARRPVQRSSVAQISRSASQDRDASAATETIRGRFPQRSGLRRLAMIVQLCCLR
jgi:hypothetical protein